MAELGAGRRAESVKTYLESKLYPVLQTALLDLLNHVDASGELQKYWKQFEEADERAREEAKKIERERRRLEMGSDYESEAEEYEDEEEESGEPEEGSQMLSVFKPDEDAIDKPENNNNNNKNGQMMEITEKVKEEEEESKQEIPPFPEEPFCPLKYLAEALKKAKEAAEKKGDKK